MNNLLELMREHPVLRVVPFVDAEVVTDFNGWHMANWGAARVEEIYADDTRVYIRSDEDEELDGQEVEWEKVIIIYIQ